MSELSTITRHATTVLAGQLAVMAFGVTDTMVAGRYTGSQSRVQNALDSLERIKQKQAETGARMQSAAELARDSSGDALDAKLRAAGITPQAGNAQSVLERLKAQRNGNADGGKTA